LSIAPAGVYELRRAPFFMTLSRETAGVGGSIPSLATILLNPRNNLWNPLPAFTRDGWAKVAL